jgi:uncharacterized protein YqiB (DUF1249 family)
VILKTTKIQQRTFRVDIKGHHALCEMNFFRLEKLMPGYKNGISHWGYQFGGTHGSSNILASVQIKIIDRAPYTTTVEFIQSPDQRGTFSDNLLPETKLVVRLYNDVKMAEIVSWDQHRNWLPQYAYPNRQMYHPDEKLELNRFLGDWLAFCRKQGFISFNNCEQVLGYGK